MKNYADRGGCSPMSPKAELENITPSEICIILFISYKSRLVPKFFTAKLDVQNVLIVA